MKMKEAVQIIKNELIANELDLKMADKRTKLHKAITLLEDRAKWDDAKLEQIIDETIEEFESKENDYCDN